MIIKSIPYPVTDMRYYNFDEPQSVYRWLSGTTLPSVDHLLALSFLLKIKIEDILVFSTQSHPNAPA